jgi:hypothetical protein
VPIEGMLIAKQQWKSPGRERIHCVLSWSGDCILFWERYYFLLLLFFCLLIPCSGTDESNSLGFWASFSWTCSLCGKEVKNPWNSAEELTNGEITAPIWNVCVNVLWEGAEKCNFLKKIHLGKVHITSDLYNPRQSILPYSFISPV